jgi:MFS family permease
MTRPLALVRELSARTRAILLTNAVNSFGGGLVLPFLWIYLTQVRGMASWVPAVTLAVQAATAVGGGLVWGSILDRFVPRVVVGVVMATAGVGTGLYAFATNPVLVLVAALVYGLGISGVGTVLRFLYAGAASSRERGLAYSADYAVFNAMTGLGVLTGGVVAASKTGSEVARFGVLYVVDATTFLIAGALLFLLLPRVTAEVRQGDEADSASSGIGYRHVLRRRCLAALFATLAMCSMVSYGQFRSGLPGYLTQGGALGTEGLSGAFAVDIAVAVLAQILLADRIQRFRRSSVLATCAALWACAWVLVAIAGQQHGAVAVTVAIGGVVLLSVGEAAIFPAITALVNELAEPAIRGRANALLSVAVSTGAILGPALAAVTLPWARGLPLMLVLIAACVGLVGAGVALRGTLPTQADLGAAVGADTLEEPGPVHPERSFAANLDEGT